MINFLLKFINLKKTTKKTSSSGLIRVKRLTLGNIIKHQNNFTLHLTSALNNPIPTWKVNSYLSNFKINQITPLKNNYYKIKIENQSTNHEYFIKVHARLKILTLDNV